MPPQLSVVFKAKRTLTVYLSCSSPLLTSQGLYVCLRFSKQPQKGIGFKYDFLCFNSGTLENFLSYKYLTYRLYIIEDI